MPRRTPELDDNGLVLIERFEQCVEEECHLPAKGVTCQENEHHKYWPEKKWLRKTPRKFRDLPENRFMGDMCQHERYHGQFSGVPIPRFDVMHRVLEESGWRKDVTEQRKRIDDKYKATTSSLARKGSLDEIEDSIGEELEQLELSRMRIATIELIPMSYVFESVNMIHATHEAIEQTRQLFVEGVLPAPPYPPPPPRRPDRVLP